MGVRIVKCHAIVDVQCHAVIRVVIGVHVLLSPHLLLATLCPNSHTVSVHPTLSRSHSFHVFHCILTAFEVWHLHVVEEAATRQEGREEEVFEEYEAPRGQTRPPPGMRPGVLGPRAAAGAGSQVVHGCWCTSTVAGRHGAGGCT